MASVYKIHPAIGVARLGNHESAFYIGPEEPGSPGVEIGPSGTEKPVKAYKADKKIKRQGARFRVFEYDQDATGALTLVGEVPARQVTWSVLLCNSKGALVDKVGPCGPKRNDGTPRDILTIRPPGPVTVAGANHRPVPMGGTFLGEGVYLGEARTDKDGRLIVLGGRGKSGGVPPESPLRESYNNDFWYDDVSDGPVTAVVTRSNGESVTVQHPSWVVVGPPDFAPTINTPVSLYSILFQAAVEKGFLKPAQKPSFTRDIRPLVERTVAMAWVHKWEWSKLMPVAWDKLADPGPGAEPDRIAWAELLRVPRLEKYELPRYLSKYVDQWENGNFISGVEDQPEADSLPDRLDRASLDAALGASFHPGIEAGQNLKNKDLYQEPFRLDPKKVKEGHLTQVMAVPWQADFEGCSGNWWPSQRPDIAMTDVRDIARGKPAEWANPIDSYETMIAHVMQLGFVVEQQVGSRTVFLEAERDPGFKRNPRP